MGRFNNSNNQVSHEKSKVADESAIKFSIENSSTLVIDVDLIQKERHKAIK